MKLAIAIIAVAAYEFFVGDIREFRDWVAGCDNLMHCHATSLPEEEIVSPEEVPIGDGTLSMSLKTSPVPGDPIRIEIAIVGEVDAARFDGIESIAVDDKRIDLGSPSKGGPYKLAHDDSLLFIQHSREAEKAALIDRSGQEVAAISLRGWRDVLSYIDSRQYRKGTRSALSELGSASWNYSIIPVMAPQMTLLVAPKSKRSPAKIDNDALSKLRAVDPCRFHTDDVPTAEPSHYRLDNANSLLILPTSCGGYNPYRMLFIVGEDGRAKKAEFWPYPGNDMNEDPELPDVHWDEEARVLRSYGRGRVVSDCGQAADFVWHKGKFRLVEFKSIYPCRGSFDYITTYRREVKIASANGSTD